MLRFTLRALARKAPAKASNKAGAAATASSHAAVTAPQHGITIPPIPGVRSARALRSQKMMATPLAPPTLTAAKKTVAQKGTKNALLTPKSRSLKDARVPKKAASPAKAIAPVKAATSAKTMQTRRVTAPKNAAKKITNAAKVSKTRK